MYTLKYNGQLLHDPRTKDRFVRAASFRLVVGEAGSGTFTVDSTNPAITALRRMSGQVELLQDGSPIYRGRILRDTTDFYQSREIVTEGAMAYLNDSLVPPFNYPEDYPEAEGAENTVAVLFNWFLDIHNASVSEDQQIKPGVVTVTDPNNYIARSSDKYLSTLEAIRTRLVNTLGGYLLMRYEPDGGRNGLLISLISIAILGVILWGKYYRRRGENPEFVSEDEKPGRSWNLKPIKIRALKPFRAGNIKPIGKKRG